MWFQAPQDHTGRGWRGEWVHKAHHGHYVPSLIIWNLPRESTQGSQKTPLTTLLIDIAEQRRHLNNQDHSTVNFLGRFSLLMCNDGMCSSLSTFLLFLIMTYDEITFWQDERRRRKIEQKIDSRNRKREKATERKEERVKTIHDKDKRRSFTEKGDAWKRLKEKMMERWRRWRGIFCHRNERIGSTLCTTITTCIYMPSLDTALSIYALEFSR